MLLETIDMRPKPKNWKSLLTGNEFLYLEYSNHGHGGEYKGYKDLPKGEYPYTIVYEEDNGFWWEQTK